MRHLLDFQIFKRSNGKKSRINVIETVPKEMIVEDVSAKYLQIKEEQMVKEVTNTNIFGYLFV